MTIIQVIPDRTGQNVCVSEIVAVVGQLDKLCDRVVLEHQRELVGGGTPPGNGWRNVEKKLKY